MSLKKKNIVKKFLIMYQGLSIYCQLQVDMLMMIYRRPAAALDTQRIVVDGYKKKKLRKKIVTPKMILISFPHSPKLTHSLVPSK